MGLISYMGPSVMQRSCTEARLGNGQCELLELTGVYGTGDGMALWEQLIKQHSPRIPEATKETLLGVEVRFGLWWRVFFSKESQGTVRVRIVEDSTLISSNKIFEKLFSFRCGPRRN
ncbi:hypothetical protein RB195_022578 [Necator americanus]|uniref:Uncharacterized protein n=1 Tax=Necator americanus TaxID=51031 RepID=A0ABR1EG36_NECAM